MILPSWLKPLILFQLIIPATVQKVQKKYDGGKAFSIGRQSSIEKNKVQVSLQVLSKTMNK
jgi:hypothetical protein